MAPSEDPFTSYGPTSCPKRFRRRSKRRRCWRRGGPHRPGSGGKGGLEPQFLLQIPGQRVPLQRHDEGEIITLSLTLEHRSGVLSSVLGYLASLGCNVLTIHQTIPLQGMANVALSVDTAQVTKKLTEIT